MDALTEVSLHQRLDQIEAVLSRVVAVLTEQAGHGGARKAPEPAKGRTVKVAEFCARYGISRPTFRRSLGHVFTLRRANPRSHPRLMADEVELFFSDGPEAVVNFRRRMNRV